MLATFNFNNSIVRYILGIESPLVCDILPFADDYHGLMDVTVDQFEHHEEEPTSTETPR